MEPCCHFQVDNVGSKQMQQIRFALRGTAVVLMGKNTRIRKVGSSSFSSSCIGLSGLCLKAERA
jgi:hypothetical protein